MLRLYIGSYRKILRGRVPRGSKKWNMMETVDSFRHPGWRWRGEPGADGNGGSWTLDDVGKLRIEPAQQRDYWSKTYYSPCLVKTDGQSMYESVASDVEATLHLGLTFEPRAQFDQVGAFVRVSKTCWVKCGIEFCDGSPMLSCVVTNDGFSDWSTAPWTAWDPKARATSIRIRVHKIQPGPAQGHCLVFEAAPYAAGDEADSTPEHFRMVRIASLRSGDAPWEMGPLCLCPVEQKGCAAVYHYVRLGGKVPPVHEGDSTGMSSN